MLEIERESFSDFDIIGSFNLKDLKECLESDDNLIAQIVLRLERCEVILNICNDYFKKIGNYSITDLISRFRNVLSISIEFMNKNDNFISSSR